MPRDDNPQGRVVPLVIIERDDGAELARIPDVVSVPRVGDHVEKLDDVLLVTAVRWELADGPLTTVLVICARP